MKYITEEEFNERYEKAIKDHIKDTTMLLKEPMSMGLVSILKEDIKTLESLTTLKEKLPYAKKLYESIGGGMVYVYDDEEEMLTYIGMNKKELKRHNEMMGKNTGVFI